MERRKSETINAHPATAPRTPVVSAVPAHDQHLPDAPTFAQVRRACEHAIRAGDHKIAWRVAQVLIRRFPDALAPSMLLGSALVAGNQHAMAVQHYKFLIKRNVTDAPAWTGLAAVLTGCGSSQAGTVALQRAYCVDPLDAQGNPREGITHIPHSHGILLLKRGNAVMAATELSNALKTVPHRADIRWYAIDALRRAGNLDEARRLLSHHDFDPEPEFPVLLLRVALSTALDVIQVTREQILAMDPDGSYTRAFFGADSVPFRIPAVPRVRWDAELAKLQAYLDADQEAQLRAERGTDLPQPAAPEPTQPTAPAPQVPVLVANDGQVHLIIGNRAVLQRRFGADGFRRIEDQLTAACGVLRTQGMTICRGYIDAPQTLGLGDMQFTEPVPADPMAVRDFIRRVAAHCTAAQVELATVVIIGGDECIPFHRLSNPIPDDDRVIFSDNPYACDDSGYLIPQRIVSRLPEGDDDDPTLLLSMLVSMTDYHRTAHHQGRSGFDVAAWVRIRSAVGDRLARGVAAEVWQEPSRLVLRNLHADARLILSPPHTSQPGTHKIIAGREVLYLNLHGAAGMPHFYGQPADVWGAATALPIALSPDHIQRSAVAGTIIISEACYGAELAGRNIRNSIPLRALSLGALAFIGATVNAYGSSAAPLLGADLLFERLTHHLATGMPVGMALHYARLEFAQIMYERQGFLDDVDMKTLIEFILLGDPWATMKGGMTQPTIRHTTSTGSMQLQAVARVPKTVRRMLLTERDISPEMLRHARTVLEQYVPTSQSRSMSIVATTNPGVHSKGAQSPEVRFSMTSLVQTSDGQWLPKNVHVTMNTHTGNKIYVSR